MSEAYDLNIPTFGDVHAESGVTVEEANEMCLLACAMLSKRAFRELAEKASGEWFTIHAHQRLFEAMSALFWGGCPEFDVSLCMAELGKEGMLAVGGVDYLRQILDCVSSPSLTPFYTEKVADSWRRRVIMARGRELVKAVKNPQGDYRAAAAAMLDGLYQGEAGLMTSVEAQAAATRLGAWSGSGTPTGLPKFDDATKSGGLDPGQYGIMSAASGLGKTLAGVQMARNAAMAGKRVLFVTLELPVARLWARLMRQECGFSDVHEARRLGGYGEWEAAEERVAAYSPDIEWIDMAGASTGKPTPQSVFGRIESHPHHDIFVVDFLQRMRSAKGNGTFDTAEEVAAVAFSYVTRSGKSGWLLSQEGESGDRYGRIAGGEETVKLAAHWLRFHQTKQGDPSAGHSLTCEKNREGKSKWTEPVVRDDTHGVWRGAR